MSNWDFYLLQFSALFHYFTQLIAYVISAKILFCDKNVKGNKKNTKLFIKQRIFIFTLFFHLTNHAKIIAKDNKKRLCSSVTTNSQI